MILDALRTKDARLVVGLSAAQAASQAGFGAERWLAGRLQRGRG